jgi:hypothetical protein
MPRPTLDRRDRHERLGARRALTEAREIYRRRSGSRPAEPAAQPPGPSRTTALARQAAKRLTTRPAALTRRDDPDVYLDIPQLHVDDIKLKVAELDARVALEARVLDLLQLNVGVDARLRGVELDIEGVDAEAVLKVRLDNLSTIVDRVMRTIDSNPQMLEQLVARLGATVDELGTNAVRAVRGDLPKPADPAGGQLPPEPGPAT